jgi:hypothetical protein
VKLDTCGWYALDANDIAPIGETLNGSVWGLEAFVDGCDDLNDIYVMCDSRSQCRSDQRIQLKVSS